MAQSLSNILIHIIFSTKNRQPMIFPEIMKELHSYMVGIAQACNAQVHEIGGIEDHVHLLISLPRILPISKLIEEIKKSSSKWVKTKGNSYIDFAWQNGYGAFSIGQSAYENLRKYIQTQKTHHQKISFQDEYRAFLKKYRISYDEKYVWD
ncbi:MAG: IS200/IS605 family transposase [Parachlamydiaceae bacterium]|nr:IS200/IS605 family transposase [Parachlamydiaceae bacterium]